jgi:hypothetical protein
MRRKSSNLPNISRIIFTWTSFVYFLLQLEQKTFENDIFI